MQWAPAGPVTQFDSSSHRSRRLDSTTMKNAAIGEKLTLNPDVLVIAEIR
jgi:hypothetical protein